MTQNDTPPGGVTDGTQGVPGLEALNEQLLYGLLRGQGVIDTLKPEQIRALIPIARGDTLEQIAAAVGRGRKTINRWLNQEDFKKAVTATVIAIYTYGLRGCAVASLEAVALLRHAVKDTSAKMGDRIRAASIIIDLGERYQNYHLAERITELERRLAMRAGEEIPEEEDVEEEVDDDAD